MYEKINIKKYCMDLKEQKHLIPIDKKEFCKIFDLKNFYLCYDSYVYEVFLPNFIYNNYFKELEVNDNTIKLPIYIHLKDIILPKNKHNAGFFKNKSELKKLRCSDETKSKINKYIDFSSDKYLNELKELVYPDSQDKKVFNLLPDTVYITSRLFKDLNQLKKYFSLTLKNYYFDSNFNIKTEVYFFAYFKLNDIDYLNNVINLETSFSNRNNTFISDFIYHNEAKLIFEEDLYLNQYSNNIKSKKHNFNKKDLIDERIKYHEQHLKKLNNLLNENVSF